MLTATQLATLKAHVAANTNTIPAGQPWSGSFVDVAVKDVPNNSDGNAAVAGWYGLTAAPAFKVYRQSVPMSEIMLNGFNWTRVDNLSIGKARIWDWMFNADPFGHTIDPSKANIRAGINAVWVGTQADLDVRAAVYLHCFRDAKNGETVFASGAGTAADATGEGPGTTTLTEPITAQDVNSALNLS